MPISPDPEKAAKQKANLLPNGGGTGGRPKGSKNWSTIVQEALNDEELFTQLLSSMERKPAWLATASPKTLIQAITIAQSLKALGGSHFSADWVRKTGYGDKIDITSGGERLRLEPVIVTHLKPRNLPIEGEVVENKQIEDEDISTDESKASSETTPSS